MQPPRGGGGSVRMRDHIMFVWFLLLLQMPVFFESGEAVTTTVSPTTVDDGSCDPNADTPCQDPHAFCSYNYYHGTHTCQCYHPYQAGTSNYNCVPQTGYVGGPCYTYSNQNCSDANAFCSETDNTCQCKTPFQPRSSDLTCVYAECGGTLTSRTGTIVTPILTSIPAEGMECVWTITTDDQHKINLYTQLFNFLWSPGCAGAYVESWGGTTDSSNSSSRTGRVCETYYSIGSGSVDSVVNLRYFVTPGQENASFAANWNSVCEKHLSHSGQIRSPGFPNSYPAQKSCSFYFSNSGYYETKLTFTTFNIPTDDNGTCASDYIRVNVNGYSYYWESSQTFCGSDLPPVLTGVYYMYFVSGEAAGAGVGFEATFTKQLRCGTTNKTNNYESWSIPNGNYDNIEGGCTWTITVEEGKTILLYFDYISLEGSEGCASEYVKIYDGPSKDDSPLVATYCGYTSQRIVESTSNSLVVEYYSNGSNIYPYGYLEYQAVNPTTQGCESLEMTAEEGSFSLPKIYPGVYIGSLSELRKNGTCRWTITAPEGFAVQVAFESFYINTYSMTSPNPYENVKKDISEICPNSSMTVFDGIAEQDSAVIAKLCGWERPWLMTSTSNSLVVVVVLDEDGGYTRARMDARYVFVNASQVNRGCGEKNLDGAGGLIMSPNYPLDYDNLLDCEWLITVDPAFTIRLDVSDFSVEASSNCMYDSVQIRDGWSVFAPYIVAPFCENYYYYYHYKFNTGSNRMFIKFVTNSGGTSRGFNGTWSRICEKVLHGYENTSTLQSPYYPQNYINDLQCRYTFYLYSPGYRLILNFTSFQLEGAHSNSSCTNDYIEIEEQQHWIQSQLGGSESGPRRFCGDSSPGEITTYYHTVVHFITNGDTTASGFKLEYKYERAECGASHISGQTGTVTSPGHPGTYPKGINCTTTIEVPAGETINLVFDDWYMGNFWAGANTEGDICRNMLRWRSGAVLEIFDDGYVSNQNQSVGIFCGVAAPLPFTSTSNILTLVFTAGYNWEMARGFSATFVSSGVSTVFDDCGGEVNGTDGIITSPFYPEKYPNNSICEWIVTGDPGDTIRMSFVDFHLQDSPSCQMDSLELRDGRGEFAPRLDRTCGDVIPLDVTSTGNVMHVKFVSDFDMSFTGFKATWVSLCEEIYRTSSGTITSPSNSGRRKQCTYIIEQPEWGGFVVKLEFNHFQLEGNPSNCGQNYLEVRDGGFDQSPLLGQRYCGTTLPPVLTSTSTMMWIRYVTDGSASTVGFSATFSRAEHTCGTTTLSAKEGIFTSPSYPNNYPNNVECTWEIMTEANHVIRLTFDSFLLEGPSGWCWWDWVRIYDGGSLVGDKYCGVSAPDTITSTSNRLTVVFRSDWIITFDGFSASYLSYDPSSDELTRQYDLYPFGPENGDEELEEKDKPQKIKIKTGFPVGKELEKNMFVASKGLVSFGNKEKGKKFKLKDEKMMLCAYCSNIQDKNYRDGGVYYQLHTNTPTVLNKATEEVREFTDLKDYKASLVLVVTWYRVQHRDSPNPDEERATFQVALISDGMRSFALVYYQKHAMKWPYLEGEPLVIGLSLGNPDSVIENMYSDTPEAFTSLDKIVGNTGRQGMWIYEIGDSYSADQACQDWYDRNLALDAERQAGFERLPECPCSWWWLWGNWRWAYWRNDYRSICFRMTAGSSRSVAPYGKECCYNTDWESWETWGQYLLDAPNAGSATAFNPAFWSLLSDYQREDRQAHDICCYNTTSSDYCRMYYELRPTGECTTRIPFRFSWTWGDPHILTLDGSTYTFNGWGEYTMITMTTADLTFTLQGRTGLAITENGTIANATVFTAFGASENGIDVTVDLDPNTNDTMIIYANGTDYTTDFYQNANSFEVEYEAFLLSNTNSSFKVTFTSGIQLTISVGFNSLDISVTMPVAYQNQTRGLLGNFNGVKGDDFILPDGRTLASDLTERQIFEDFGPAWAVTESNSVLRYPAREGPANYAHPEFVPIFLDEQPADVRKAAEDLCGATNLACVYDYVATGSTAFASASRDTADTAARTEEVSKNTVPVLGFNGSLVVTSGNAATFNLQGYDPDDGDTLTYYAVNAGGSAVRVDNATGDVTVILDASNPVALSFFAKDSKNVQSPKRDVTVIVCPLCSGHGTCNTTNAVASEVSGFMIAGCTCHPAWTGSDCSEDYDACEESPCSAQQTCTDLTPQQQGDSEIGFTCTACAGGFVVDPDDPTSCIDINECEQGTANCAVNCTNLPGSYQCGCPHGYRLNHDGVSCDDINECADRTAGCQQECVNSRGSFLCICFPGYTLSAKGTCEADQSTADLCRVAGCAHGCTTQTAEFGNVTASCFCNVGYVPHPNNSSACMDLDECQEGFCSQSCTNTYGSFACTCYTGHVLESDQRTCSPCQGIQYGPECRLKCTCNGRAAKCDPVTGCVCKAGWTGSHCEYDINECEENPDVCPKGQICSNTNGSYACNCPAGYTKSADGNCQDVNECVVSYLQPACGELETCHNVEGSYYCTCISGYTRKNRQCTDIDECAGSTKKCQQLCINRPGSYNCDCYYGYRLNQERTQCIQVGDVCKEFEGLECSQGCTIDDVTDRAVCFCGAGYKLATDGQTCLDENECTSGVAACSHTCINTPGGFNCSCPVGKMLDNDEKTCYNCPLGKWGQNCAHDCACSLGATRCDAAAGCQCKSGWTGEKCDQDVDECDTLAGQLECQARGAVCQNLQGSYRCQCQSGYGKNADGDCEDINECANSPCGQQCENTPGSYRCVCNKGFTLNATTGQCKDVNECALSITNNCTQLCINTPGGYRCDCSATGYVLSNDGVTCRATSSCNRTDCPSEHGGCSQEQCFCNSGYELSTGETTCNRTAMDWCAQNVCEQTCTAALDGMSYRCGCDDGYTLNADKSTCRECQTGTYGPGCSQNCTCNMLHTTSCDKTGGTCSCKAGWEGPTCENDVNECISVTCPAHALCLNTRGSYLCYCEAGYSKKNGICAECDTNFFGENCAQQCTCSSNTVSCDKVTGTCKCQTGWEGARCDVDIDECIHGANGCSGDHLICVNTDGGFKCECEQGYTRNETTGACVDKDECFTQENNCDHECTNTVGGYTCGCGIEYEGTGNVCRKLTLVPMQMKVDIPVPASDVASPYSQTYKNWTILVQQALYDRFKPKVPGLKAVIVRSLRVGSLIVVYDCVVDEQVDPNYASDLSSVVLVLVGEQLTVGGLTGGVVVNLTGVVVDSSMALCDVYEAISPCGADEGCQESSGRASCVKNGSEESEESDNNLGMIIGLSVAIPIAALVGAIIVAIYFKKRPGPQTTPVVHDQVYSISINEANGGVGPSATHMRTPSPISASPVPSLTSILAYVDGRPSRRKGSWTENM